MTSTYIRKIKFKFKNKCLIKKGEQEKMNPMEEFKKQLTKEIQLGKKQKILIKVLNAKDSTDIENRVALSSAKDTMSEYQVRKIETLTKCIISIDNIQLKDFPDVQNDIKNSMPIDEAIKKEILSWDNIITDKIYSYYLQFLKERNEQIDKDINFQISLS